MLVLIRWFLHSTITLGIKNAEKNKKPAVNDIPMEYEEKEKNTKGLELCQNCQRIIGKLEQAYVYKDNIVCEECNTRLTNGR